MFTVEYEPITESLLQGRVKLGGAPVGQLQFIRSWLTDRDARSIFLKALSGVGFPAFRWECPPLIDADSGRSFEFVVVADRSLARAPDFVPFLPQFEDARTPVVSFPTLGRDAQLVVPVPPQPILDYAHLGAFLRHAPEEVQHSLLVEVARQVASRISGEPLWLSTAGGGVAWLHVRLDSRPKYYGHSPYRQAR
jgi:hypothetical protein